LQNAKIVDDNMILL